MSEKLRKSCKKILVYILSFVILWQDIILAHALSPVDIGNKVFYLDAQNIDGNNNSADDPSNWSQVEIIVDNFNSHSWSQITGAKRPIFTENSINSYPALNFDGSNDLLEMHDHLDIGSGTGYSQKSFSLVFQSGNDVTSPQTIYEQGGKEKWFLFHIFGGNLYAGAYNTLDWSSGEQIKILDLWSITTNTNYVLTLSFDSVSDSLSAYLNGAPASPLGSLAMQATNGTCPLDGTSFWCNLYLSGGSIGIWAVKNDTYDVQTNTWTTLFEGYFFSWFIGEIASWNTALTNTQQWELTDFLMTKWWFDSLAPEITDIPFASGTLLPGGNHTLSYSYQDTGTWASGIDISSISFEILPWEWGSWWGALSASQISTGSITASGASFITNNLETGRYLLQINIADERWNQVTDERIIYIDTPEFTLSDSEMNLGSIEAWEIKNSNTLNLNVRTLGAAFRITLEKENTLKQIIGWEEMETWNGSSGYWYKVDSGAIQNDSTSSIIVNQAAVSNFSDTPINYNYTVDLEALINTETFAWDYEGSYSFHIEFDY